MTPTTSSARPFDYFIAYASPDTALAEGMQDALSRVGISAFVVSRSITLGDSWDGAIQRAQESAYATVVLVSPSTGDAYFQREEIQRGLEMARHDPTKHRVIPIFIGGMSLAGVPYGLRLKHGVSVPDRADIGDVLEELVGLHTLLRRFDPRAPERTPYVTPVVRSRPGLVAILLDQSEHLREEGEAPMIETAKSVDNLLFDMIVRCAKPDNVSDYFDVMVAGYNERAFHLIGTSDTGDPIPISLVAERPLPIAETNNGSRPRWIEPCASGRQQFSSGLNYVGERVAAVDRATRRLLPSNRNSRYSRRRYH